MKTIVAKTGNRVERLTTPASRARIERKTRRGVRASGQGGRRAISRRLRQLDREWDVERTIEANASTLALAGTLLGLLRHRYFLALPITVCGFLLQHAIQGWCPPVPLLRRLGFRTVREIDEERYALKALRGDFRRLGTSRNNYDRALRSARR
jgi:hypothetical protein